MNPKAKNPRPHLYLIDGSGYIFRAFHAIRNSMTNSKGLRREAAQLPLDEKRRRADFVVPNNESPEELEQAVGDVLAKITAA